MRTKIFFFAMLASVAASATVTVTPLSTDYTTKKVTFKVAWTNSPTAPYNNRVWIWIDFCPVADAIPAASFSTATISNPAKTGGNGNITNATARGFFVEYSTTNAGTTVTATLSNAPAGKFNWCAYDSDYPPNATMNNGTYALKGSYPFVVNNTTLGAGVNSFSGTCITALTDATGCPGIINNNFTPGSITSATYNSCNNVAGTATTVATAPTGSNSYSYQWTVSYNNGTAATVSGATAAVYTPPATATAGTYRYIRQVKDNLCSTAYTNSTGTITRIVYTALTAGAINSSSTIVRTNTAPAAITNSTAASGGSGGVTYRWVRSGTSSNTYTDNSVGHSFTAAEYNTAGTWTYYRQVRDNTCATTTWQQSSGSYSLVVIACPYTGSDLYMTSSYPCQKRTSGAGNWQAYIRDSRDSEIYRIVLMPDNKWWLAQNVKFAQTGLAISISGCTPEKCGRYYESDQFNKAFGGSSGWGENKQGVCPNGWVLPTLSNWTTLVNSIS
ncbi:MAG: hypothetical protein LBG31_03495, partial [Prevotellaceae bacterium]|nr:hypothetical protein [Prevotellaceae bacterium]